MKRKYRSARNTRCGGTKTYSTPLQVKPLVQIGPYLEEKPLNQLRGIQKPSTSTSHSQAKIQGILNGIRTLTMVSPHLVIRAILYTLQYVSISYTQVM